MENNQSEKYLEYIRSLSYDKLTGVLEDDELEYLETQLKTSQMARDTWSNILNKHNSEGARAFFGNPVYTARSLRLEELLQEPGKRRIRRVVAIGIISVAALVIVGLFIAILMKRAPVKDPLYENQISLKTPDGKVIPIAGNKIFQTGGVTVSARDSAMTFSGMGSAAAGAMNILTVPSGLDYKITLSDGTLVWLNSETRLEFPFKFSADREIRITGEAYLEVAPDAARLFSVRLPGDRIVQVLGTTININSYDAREARISLVSGLVRVKAGGNTLTLKPGYEAISDGASIRQSQFNMADVLAWRQGKFYFNTIPLEEVVKVLRRWYGIPVVIDNPAMANKTFTGSLDRSKPIEEFLDNATDILKISYYKEDGVLHIR